MQRTLIRTSWTQKSGHLCLIASSCEHVKCECFKAWICWSIERHWPLMDLYSYVYHEPTTFLVDHILIYITLEFKFIRLFVAHASRELNKSKLWNKPQLLAQTTSWAQMSIVNYLLIVLVVNYCTISFYIQPTCSVITLHNTQ